MFTEERALWLYENYLWLEANLPERPAIGQSRFVLANSEFFPLPFPPDHTGASNLFSCVQKIMGMEDWPCTFEQRESWQDELKSNLQNSGVLGNLSSGDPGGTFSIQENGEVVISYSSHTLKDPAGLVSTLAHELCHYLLAKVPGEPPATWSELEPLTDLSAVREGFGIFLCNTAFEFRQWSKPGKQGWSVKTKGYLTETELAFCTAIFTVRNDIDPRIALRALKPNPKEVYLDALDYIADLEEQYAHSDLIPEGRS